MNTKQNQITHARWQQGDVLGLRIAALPAGCKRLPSDARGVVLAEGEHTGHYHGIEDSGVALMEAPGGTRYLVNESDAPVTIKHQEHRPVTVDPGIWQIGGVREKDWFTEMVRPVVD